MKDSFELRRDISPGDFNACIKFLFRNEQAKFDIPEIETSLVSYFSPLSSLSLIM